ADEGFEVFDLTPGSDPYKDTLATEHIISYKLTFQNPTTQTIVKFKYIISDRLKKFLTRIGISSHQQRNTKNEMSIAVEKIKILAQHRSLSMLLNALVPSGESSTNKTFTIQYNTNRENTIRSQIKTNSLGDLLDFEPGGTLLTKREFLGDAMKRLEAGQEFYSLTQGSKLLCAVWKEQSGTGKKGLNQQPGDRDESSILTNL